MTSQPPSPRNAQSLWRHLPLLSILIVAAIGAFFLRDWISLETLSDNRMALLAYRDAHYPTMAMVFLLGYVLIVAFSLPGATIASITGGFLFGLWAGTALNVIAATIGACLIFQAARMGLGAILTTKIEQSGGNLKRIKNGLRNNEISVLFLMRLLPVVPFFVGNVLPALVGVRFVNYSLTTFFGIIPGAFVYTSIGSGLNEVFARGERPNLSVLWEPYVIGPILGLSALALLPILIRIWFPKKDYSDDHAFEQD